MYCYMMVYCIGIKKYNQFYIYYVASTTLEEMTSIIKFAQHIQDVGTDPTAAYCPYFMNLHFRGRLLQLANWTASFG